MYSQHLNKAKSMFQKVIKGQKYKNIGRLGKTMHIRAERMYITSDYDCIWINWGLGYLTKSDSLNLLSSCKNALQRGKEENKPGILFDKETVTRPTEL